MCGTARSRGGVRHDPIISGGRREMSRSPLLSESILNYASGVGGAVGGAAYHSGSSDEKAPPPSSSQELLFIQPAAGKTKQNSRNTKRTSSQQQAENNNVKKWKCHKCTYENWPRAVKCIMCQAPRRRTPSPPLSGGEERETTSRAQLPTVSVKSHQTVARLASSPSPSSSSSSPDHSRSGSNSNEVVATSPDVANTAASSHKETGSGSRLIAEYERENYVEIVPSAQLKSDSDEVNFVVYLEGGGEKDGGGWGERERERERGIVFGNKRNFIDHCHNLVTV